MLLQLGAHERIEVVSVEVRFRAFGEVLLVVGQGVIIHSRRSNRTRLAFPIGSCRVFRPGREFKAKVLSDTARSIASDERPAGHPADARPAVADGGRPRARPTPPAPRLRGGAGRVIHARPVRRRTIGRNRRVAQQAPGATRPTIVQQRSTVGRSSAHGGFGRDRRQFSTASISKASALFNAACPARWPRPCPNRATTRSCVGTMITCCPPAPAM